MSTQHINTKKHYLIQLLKSPVFYIKIGSTCLLALSDKSNDTKDLYDYHTAKSHRLFTKNTY